VSKKIAVIGAGPMGLAVAYQLAQDGYEPIIFEAGEKIGGMTAAFNFSGLMIERYYHFHCTADLDFLKILDELNLSNKMFWVETKMGFWFKDKLQPWGNPIALLKFKGLNFLIKLRYALHIFLSVKRNNWKVLDNLDATRWIKRWIGNEAYDSLWKPLFDFKFYDYSNTISAAWIWGRIRRIGRSRYSIFREKLGYLEGGSETLLQSLRENIESCGGRFILNSPIEKIVIDSGKVKGIILQGKLQKFDKIVSTIPLPYVPQIIPDLPAHILNQFISKKNIAVVCVIVKLNKRFTENFWLNVNDPNMDIPGIVEYTNLRPMDCHIVYVPFYMPFEHLKFKDSNEKFIKKVRQYMQKINPALKKSDFIDICVNRYRFAQPICGPGYLKDLPPISLPIQGLWLADTSYYYPEDRGISESIKLGRDIARMVQI